MILLIKTQYVHRLVILYVYYLGPISEACQQLFRPEKTKSLVDELIPKDL